MNYDIFCVSALSFFSAFPDGAMRDLQQDICGVILSVEKATTKGGATMPEKGYTVGQVSKITGVSKDNTLEHLD